MSYFSKKRFTMRQVVGLLTIVFLGITVAAYAVNITYTFTSGNPIRASEMNQNFTDVKSAVDTLEAKVATLEGKVTTLESRVATLETKDADLITSSDNLSGQQWAGPINVGRGRTANIGIIFIDSQNATVVVTGYDSETDASSGSLVEYTPCRYRVTTGIISLGCNLGVLTDVRINRPWNTIISGFAFIGNSTLNVAHPKLAHGDFYLNKI